MFSTPTTNAISVAPTIMLRLAISSALIAEVQFWFTTQALLLWEVRRPNQQCVPAEISVNPYKPDPLRFHQ